jgi:hypothetical protein
VKKLPSDFDIFSSSTRTKPLCIHTFTNFEPQAAQVCAISFSWCGNLRSMPPPWMSKCSPSSSTDIAEHSMCQPGRPGPQGDSQDGSPGLAAFHSTKSSGSRLASSTSMRAPARRSASRLPESCPYGSKRATA